MDAGHGCLVVRVRSLCGRKAARLLLRNLCEPWWVRMAASTCETIGHILRMGVECVTAGADRRGLAAAGRKSATERTSRQLGQYFNIDIETGQIFNIGIEYSIFNLSIEFD